MIEARGLTRRFADFTAVSDATFCVPDGAILALLGPNGAGKTTTVRMLAGLLAPSEGNAIVAGCDIRRDPAEVRARVGLVTDAPGLYEQMTLPAYLDFFGSIYGMAPAARRRRIAELIEFFELRDHKKERMAGFSKGMKQKAALARALLHEPSALFLDEPTSSLDPLSARAVRELILGLKHASRSIILCTHDLDEAERLADQVAILSAGRIAALDAPAALRSQASPAATVHVELADPLPVASTIAELTALPAVSDLALSGGALVYRTPDPRAANPRVVACLVAAGARIVSITCETRSLEDVYAAAVGSGGAQTALAAEDALPKAVSALARGA
jgi:ABC-2 type transport system ATP-binding protein